MSAAFLVELFAQIQFQPYFLFGEEKHHKKSDIPQYILFICECSFEQVPQKLNKSAQSHNTVLLNKEYNYIHKESEYFNRHFVLHKTGYRKSSNEYPRVQGDSQKCGLDLLTINFSSKRTKFTFRRKSFLLMLIGPFL